MTLKKFDLNIIEGKSYCLPCPAHRKFYDNTLHKSFNLLCEARESTSENPRSMVRMIHMDESSIFTDDTCMKFPHVDIVLTGVSKART
jgi:hypothetical protein